MSVEPAVDLPPGVRVTGGRGGTTAHLDDLDAAAAALDRAAAALEDAALAVRDLSDVVDEAAVRSPGTARAAWAAVDEIGVDLRALLTRDEATRLRAVAELYRSTDGRVAAGFAALVGGVVGGAIGEAGPLAWAATSAVGLAAAGQVLLARGALELLGRTTPVGLLLGGLRSAPVQRDRGLLGAVGRAAAGPLVPGLPSGRAVEQLTPGLAAFLRAAAPGRAPAGTDPLRGAAGVLLGGARVVTALAGEGRGRLVVAPVLAATGAGPGMPRTLTGTADVLREVRDLYPLAGTGAVGAPGAAAAGRGGAALAPGTPAGTVSVRRLDHADGARSWVVAVPGTQEWSPVAGPNPMDVTTNLELTAGVPDDATRVVVEAMTQAGIAPGEPVLLAGHSQGGMVAMAIAADPGLADDVTVAAVVTAGSPVAGTQLPEHVQALHLEHEQDYVWTLDGAPNPGAANRTTVAADLTASAAVENRLAAGSPVTAHDVGAYVRTAEELAGSDHPSVRAFEDAVAQVLGDGTAEVTSRRYTGVRVP